MADRDFQVKPLFAEPYFVTNIADLVTPKHVDVLKSLEMVDNQVNKISKNLYIFEEPALRGLARAVQDALDIYAREVMGIVQKLYVTQSWTLVNPPGVGMHGHSHSNSLISGSLYYTDLPDPPASMIFERHTSYQLIELRPNTGQPDNIYNATRNAVVPKKGDIVLFPSKLQHYVEPNASLQPRHSIAFNSFVKGKIGSFRDVSELKL